MKRRAIMMVAALALAGGACGGDDDSGATDDAAATSDEPNGDADSGDEDDDSSGGEWCDLALDLESNSAIDDVDINDPDAIENAFEEMIDLSEEAADSAPDEIKDDVELLVDRTKELVEELRDVDFDFTALDESVLEDPEMTAAGERLDTYLARECGFDDDTGDTVDIGEVGEISGTDEEVARGQMVQVFTSMGMTDEQANCVADNIDFDALDETANVDPTEYFDLFEDCGFDMANPGG